jgi:hypothetical protein
MRKPAQIAAVVSALVLSPMAIPQASARQTVEVAFVLDTTGSMGPLIEGAKRKIWSTGDGDLADYAACRKLDQIREDELPTALRALPKPQLSAALEEQSNERKELNAKLAGLVAKRDAYIAEQRGKQEPRTSSFDQAVAATLKARIKKL